ncbi:hypothetical protein PSECIP111951_00667 [Pseudoalteromonas holothuriae]|uniref:Polysaccharide biosynthesis protein n=1 Tax=Pseudoalteromonas holothuriae TaxID=2963714 RepID=A0ABN8ULQ9_9GAMM|nr:SLBB domain-containing protein [Pseudoalteromonas sp. CIP111951]CAH9052674.1 hypothetical protein PSECIP111951_00667 [Pseudoalteromonas sp. CIP111951]
MKLSKLTVFFVLFSIFVLNLGVAQAVSPSPKQVEQFKRLPKAQQEALAKKYGIDLSSLGLNTEDQQSDKKDAGITIKQRQLQRNLDEEPLTEEDKFKPKKEELKPFGYELFAEANDNFLPSDTATVPSTYNVGAGDKFNISYFGKESLDMTIEVDSEGSLPLPLLSPVRVMGMTFAEVKSLVEKRVSQKIIGVEAHIAIVELKPVRVVLVGEVKYPGSYSLPALSSITHAIFASGGITEIGSLRHIQLKRSSKVNTKLDLYDLLLSGDNSQDKLLESGDVIFVPPVGKQVSISGAVLRPAIYELTESEDMGSLLVMSGGEKPGAQTSKTVIERFSGNSLKTVVKADLAKRKIPLQAGDKVYIPNSSNEFDNAITLIGAVTYPGRYAWHENSKISDVITSIRADLLPIADYSYGLLLREKGTTGMLEVHQFSPFQALQKADGFDLKLEPRDSILIFSRFEEQELEEKQLVKLAVTKDELKLNDKIALWQDYEQTQFYEFINLAAELDKQLQEGQQANDSAGKNIDDILRGQKSELDEDEYAVFSRRKLLEPLLLRLQQQASASNGLKIYNISGEVRYPGVYPLPVNSTIENAVAAAGGLKESAFTEIAEITRFVTGKGARVEHINLALSEELGKGNSSTRIQSKDSINILPKPDWQQSYKVNLVGEFKFPGTYSIKRGETLQDVIRRAGGITDYAFARGAIFTREAIRQNEQKQINELSARLRRDIASSSFQSSITSSKLSYADMDRLLGDLSKIDALGRLVINLDEVIEGQQKIELRDNDTLYIPTQQHTVSVVGEVNVATAHLYEETQTLESYLKISGGLKQRADDERIYIIKADGSVRVPKRGSWFAVANNTEIEPGDTIVVPLDSEYMDELTLWSTATQIVYQIGVAAAAVSSF